MTGLVMICVWIAPIYPSHKWTKTIYILCWSKNMVKGCMSCGRNHATFDEDVRPTVYSTVGLPTATRPNLKEGREKREEVEGVFSFGQDPLGCWLRNRHMNFVAGTDPASVTRDIDGQKEVNLT